MSFEDELRDRLRAGVIGTEVDTEMLTTGGLARGTRGVRRRRFGQIVAAGAALTVLGSAAAYASWFTGAPTQVAGPPTITAGPTKTATTPQAALQILLDLLPPQAPTGDYTGGHDPARKTGSAGLWGVLTYAGKTDLSLHLGRQQTKTTCTPARQGEHCSQVRLDDGSVLTTVRISALDRSRDIGWRATLDRRDGVQINLLQDYNHEVEGDGNPPLPVEAMRAIVVSPRWQLRVDAAFATEAEPLFEPRRPGPPSTPPTTTSATPR